VTQLKSCVHTVVAALIMVLPLLSITVAVADPPAGAHITDIQHVNDRWGKVSVYSPAMDKVVVNDVFKAPKAGSPTFYLLPGIDGGDNLDPAANFAPGTKSWFGSTDLQGFFADKNVNVVSPLGGQFSWYTDWVNDRSKQYQTYMTQELPPLINAQYKTNGRNAVGGLSSTGGTAADYAIQAPGLYKAVGSYSGFLTVLGCPERRTDTHWWRRKRRRHVGSAGRPAVGGARPDGERREAQGCRGLRCRVGRRAGRRRQAAPRRQ
jgi:diacylglycerol O-acyltransferase/trehalose O-mycolyltransferase